MGSRTGRREHIIEIALEAFTTRGYESTKISDLADGIGASKAAVAYYFPTKDLFLDELVTPFLDELDHAIVEPRAASKLDNPSHELLGRYLSSIINHHRVACWVDTDRILQNHPDYGHRLRAIDERLLRTVTGGSRRKNDRARALAVLGGLWRPARQMTANDLRDHHNEIVTAALDSY